MNSETVEKQEYFHLVEELKLRLRSARTKALLAVNRELIQLYWDMGRRIVEEQERLGWGRSVIEQLSKDLKQAFPDQTGLSARNLWNMRNFYCANRGHEIMQQAVAEIPWGHNLLIINKLKDPEERLWYVQETINNGWSRNVLLHQIETHLYQRQALNPKTNNFARTLPPDQSDLIEQTLKDPYIFDFLGTGKKLKERELEEGLVASLKALFLELGSGFAFMGSQFPLDVEGDIFKVDLLFYHYQLRRLVAIDLKTGPFRPEHTGKMNFYLSALDEMIKHPEDLPSLGIILCRKKKKLVAEYSLRDMGKPVGITEYRLSSQLPEEFEGKLPGPEELERLLEGFEKDKEEEELHKG